MHTVPEEFSIFLEDTHETKITATCSNKSTWWVQLCPRVRQIMREHVKLSMLDENVYRLTLAPDPSICIHVMGLTLKSDIKYVYMYNTYKYQRYDYNMAITYRAYFNAIQKETMPDIIKYLNNNKLQELSTHRNPLPYKRTDSPEMHSIKHYLFA